jgi:5-methylcytosine-specific restriction endonuclease McrA
MKRTAMKRSNKPMERGKHLVWKGRRNETRVTHSGRIILGAHHYTGLCYEVWTRDGHQCVLCHWSLPEFSTRLIDHIVKRSAALVDNPGDVAENLRTLCGRCHDAQDNGGMKLKQRAHKNILAVRHAM